MHWHIRWNIYIVCLCISKKNIQFGNLSVVIRPRCRSFRTEQTDAGGHQIRLALYHRWHELPQNRTLASDVRRTANPA